MQYTVTSFTWFIVQMFSLNCVYIFIIIYSAIQLHGCKSDNKILHVVSLEWLQQSIMKQQYSFVYVSYYNITM